MNALCKLGKRARRLDSRTLKLARYLTTSLPTPASSGGYQRKVRSWPMYLNDSLGCCVIAAMGHMIGQWTAYARGKGVILADQDILRAYSAVGGYVPGDASTDNGCDMLTALNYWRQTGIGGHKILAFAAVNWLNHVEVEQAINLFGSLFVGVALPISAQGSPVWEVPSSGPYRDGSPGSWGGHAECDVGYNAVRSGGLFNRRRPGLMPITWGARGAKTWAFMDTYCDECYVALSQEWIESRGLSPSGCDLDHLRSDLAEIT